MNGKKIIPGCNLPLMVKYADSNKKTKSRPLQSVPGLYSSLTHLEITVSLNLFFSLIQHIAILSRIYLNISLCYGIFFMTNFSSFQQPCFATPPYDQSGQYIRTNPNYQYLLTPPSPYVYSPHPQYHVFSGKFISRIVSRIIICEQFMPQ